MKRQYRQLGFTLAEMMVSCTLLLAVGTVTDALLVLTQRYVVSAQCRVAIQVNGAYALERVLLDMHDSNIVSLTNGTSSNPPAISFLSCRDKFGNAQATSTGAPYWQAYIVYYVSSSGALMWQRVVPAGLPSATATALTSTQLSNYCTGGRPMAFGLTAFSVTPNASAGSASATVTTTDSVSAGIRNQVTYTGTTYFDYNQQ